MVVANVSWEPEQVRESIAELLYVNSLAMFIRTRETGRKYFKSERKIFWQNNQIITACASKFSSTT